MAEARPSPTAEVTTLPVGKRPRESAQPTGFGLNDGATFEEWVSVGEEIAAQHSAAAWDTADWLAFGDAQYPGESVRATAERLGVSAGKISRYIAIAKAYPVLRRRNTLAFSHYQEVVPLREEIAEALLDKAEAEGWSRHQLREAVREARRDSELARKDAEIARLKSRLAEAESEESARAAVQAALGSSRKAASKTCESAVRTLKARLTREALAGLHGNAIAGLIRELKAERDKFIQFGTMHAGMIDTLVRRMEGGWVSGVDAIDCMPEATRQELGRRYEQFGGANVDKVASWLRGEGFRATVPEIKLYMHQRERARERRRQAGIEDPPLSRSGAPSPT